MSKKTMRAGAGEGSSTDSRTAATVSVERENGSSVRHTPGLWWEGGDATSIDGKTADYGAFPVVRLGDGTILARVRHVRDARLIAAAPELYAALDALREDYERLCGDGLTDANLPTVLSRAIMVLAKAEGRA